MMSNFVGVVCHCDQADEGTHVLKSLRAEGSLPAAWPWW